MVWQVSTQPVYQVSDDRVVATPVVGPARHLVTIGAGCESTLRAASLKGLRHARSAEPLPGMPNVESPPRMSSIGPPSEPIAMRRRRSSAGRADGSGSIRTIALRVDGAVWLIRRCRRRQMAHHSRQHLWHPPGRQPKAGGLSAYPTGIATGAPETVHAPEAAAFPSSPVALSPGDCRLEKVRTPQFRRRRQRRLT